MTTSTRLFTVKTSAFFKSILVRSNWPSKSDIQNQTPDIRNRVTSLHAHILLIQTFLLDIMNHPIKSNPLFQSDYTQRLAVRHDRVKELIFLGTGTSSSLPNLFCLVQLPDASHQQGCCETCLSALHGSQNGLMSKNRRRNTSLLVRYTDTETVPGSHEPASGTFSSGPQQAHQRRTRSEKASSGSSLVILDKDAFPDTPPKDQLAKGNALDDARRPRARAGPASVHRLSNVIIDCGKASQT